MGSSSLRSAGSSSRAPLLPDQLAAFYKLVDKKAIAGALCRHARDAELSASAAVQAEALYKGDDSLVVASLRMDESQSLTCLALEASGVEQATFFQQSWAALLSALPLLLRRIAANTLLPGTVREEELDYEAHVQAAIRKAMNKPVASPAGLRAAASTLGYNILLHAISTSVGLLLLQFLPAMQKRLVESFVLKGLDVIPRTAGIHANLIAGEGILVEFVEETMNPRENEPTFAHPSSASGTQML